MPFLIDAVNSQHWLAPLLGDLNKRGGARCLVIEMRGMSPSRPQGCDQADYQQLILNLQFTHCIMHKLHDWSKKVLWQEFWLDLCTKQVVSARACTNQFLPYSSSGIASFGVRTVQADSCSNSEQIDTLLLVWGFSKGVLGGGSFWAGGPKFTRDCHGCFFLRLLLPGSFFLVSSGKKLTFTPLCSLSLSFPPVRWFLTILRQSRHSLLIKPAGSSTFF